MSQYKTDYVFKKIFVFFFLFSFCLKYQIPLGRFVGHEYQQFSKHKNEIEIQNKRMAKMLR